MTLIAVMGAIAVVIVGTIAFYLWLSKPMEIESFSLLDDDISVGNPKSWSNRVNSYTDVTEYIPSNTMVYQAHGIPLPHEDHRTVSVSNSMAYYSPYNCKPECCKYSQDSCSTGCVCLTTPSQPLVLQNGKMTPRS